MQLLRLFYTFFLILLFTSCKFNLSPFMANAPNLKINDVNLSRIKTLEPTVPNSFKVALIADTHNYYENLNQVVRELKKNGPYAFIIVCGDVTNMGFLEEFNEARRYFNRFAYPYLVAVGNHDLVVNGENIFNKMFGKDDFSFVYKNVEFVIFNNNNWESGWDRPNINWVESVLSASTSPHKVLISHVPPDDPLRFTASDVSDWQNIMTNYNVDYYINGHGLKDRIQNFGSGTNITVGTLSRRVYYELLVTPGGITHKKISF